MLAEGQQIKRIEVVTLDRTCQLLKTCDCLILNQLKTQPALTKQTSSTLTLYKHRCCIKKHCGIWSCRCPGNKCVFVNYVHKCLEELLAPLQPHSMTHELGSCISLHSVPMKCTRMWMYALPCLISHVIWEQFLCRFWRTWSSTAHTCSTFGLQDCTLWHCIEQSYGQCYTAVLTFMHSAAYNRIRKFEYV